MKGIVSPLFDLESYDYGIVYNIDTNEINKLPGESGTYEFINVLYSSKNDTMKIVEYEIEYAK